LQRTYQSLKLEVLGTFWSRRRPQNGGTLEAPSQGASSTTLDRQSGEGRGRTSLLQRQLALTSALLQQPYCLLGMGRGRCDRRQAPLPLEIGPGQGPGRNQSTWGLRGTLRACKVPSTSVSLDMLMASDHLCCLWLYNIMYDFFCLRGCLIITVCLTKHMCCLPFWGHPLTSHLDRGVCTVLQVERATLASGPNETRACGWVCNNRGGCSGT
jgi:hypothetical protein